MICQLAIPFSELAAAALRQLMGCCRQVVGTVLDRHTTEPPKRRLHAATQGFKTLARANRYRLPVRVRQHKVIQQMREWLPGDDHFEFAHVGKVRLPLFSRYVCLRKEHFAEI